MHTDWLLNLFAGIAINDNDLDTIFNEYFKFEDFVSIHLNFWVLIYRDILISYACWHKDTWLCTLTCQLVAIHETFAPKPTTCQYSIIKPSAPPAQLELKPKHEICLVIGIWIRIFWCNVIVHCNSGIGINCTASAITEVRIACAEPLLRNRSNVGAARVERS